jgi:hypothetical protein
MVGASSEDIRLDTVVRIAGESIGTLDLTTRRNAWEYYTHSRGVSHWEVSKANTFARKGGYHSVRSRRDGDYVGFTKVALNGVDGIELRVATTTAGWADIRQPIIDVHLDRRSGPRIRRRELSRHRPTAPRAPALTSRSTRRNSCHRSLGCAVRSTLRSSWALRATTIVEADISTAPMAGLRVRPAHASTPAASGIAITL